MVPEGTSAADVIDVAFRRYNLALGGGLGPMAGKLFPIGHMGDPKELMLLAPLAGTEMALRDRGIQVTPGSGGAAAEEDYRSTPPSLAAPPAPHPQQPAAGAQPPP